MRSIKKKPVTVKQMERNIGRLLLEHDYSAIMPDGSLSEHFILSYLIRNNDHAAKGYGKILRAYENVKKHEVFAKLMEFRKVKKETLKKIVLYSESIVRPIKQYDDTVRGGVHVGEIIKLATPQFDEGEEWKKSLTKEEGYKVGDKVLYYIKTNIVLDDELLHLVSYFTGKFLE